MHMQLEVWRVCFIPAQDAAGTELQHKKGNFFTRSELTT